MGQTRILVVELRGDRYLVIDTLDGSVADGMSIGLAMDANIDFEESEASKLVMDVVRGDIRRLLKEEGFYFENPEKYYKRCALCGRQYTYYESKVKNTRCCGSGSYIRSEWKLAERHTLHDPQIYKVSK